MFQGLNRLFFRLVNRPSLPNIKVPHSHRSRLLFLAMKFRRIFPDVKYDGLNNADWPEARRWVPDAMRTTPCPLDSCRTPRRQLNLPV